MADDLSLWIYSLKLLLQEEKLPLSMKHNKIPNLSMKQEVEDDLPEDQTNSHISAPSSTQVLRL